MDTPSQPAPVNPADPARSAGPGFKPTREHVRGRSVPMRALGRLSSMKVAASMIALVAFSIGMATYYERDYGREAAAVMMYQAWWFNALWILIAVNIFGAAAVRYPWRKRQIGFVVVHVGLLLLMFGFYQSYGRLDGMLEVRMGESASIIQTERDRLTVIDGTGADAKRIGVSFSSTELTGLPSFARYLAHSFRVAPAPGVRTGKDLAVLLSPGGGDWWYGALAAPETFPRISVTGAVLWGDRVAGFDAGDASLPPAVGVRLRVRPPGAPTAIDMGTTWFTEAGETEKHIGPAAITLGRTRYQQLADDVMRSGADLPTLPTVVIYHANGVERLPLPPHFPYTQIISDTLTIDWVRVLERPSFDGQSLEESPEAAIDPMVIIRIGEGPESTRTWRMAPVFALHPASFAVLPEQPGQAELVYDHPILREGQAGQGVQAAVILAPQAAVLTAFSRTRGRLPGQRLTSGEDAEWELVGSGAGPMQAVATVTYVAHAQSAPRPMVVSGAKANRATRWLEITAERNGASGSTWIARGDNGDGVASIRMSDGSEVLLRYDADMYNLQDRHGFSVHLNRFIERRDPGGTRVAGYESDVTVATADGGTDYVISMNEPLTINGVTLYQSSFIPEMDATGQSVPGRYVSSVFTAATDPGRPIKYLGSLVLVSGMVIMYLLNRRIPVSRAS